MSDNIINDILFYPIIIFIFIIIALYKLWIHKIMDFDWVDCLFDDPDPCWVVHMKIMELFTNTSDDYDICDKIDHLTYRERQTPWSQNVVFL